MLLSRLLVAAILPAYLFSQSLSTQEVEMLKAADNGAPESVAMLERIVNINSGTFNLAGVKAVAAAIEPEFRALGFETRLIPMDGVKRAVHLVAQHKGAGAGKPVLLIGHMDTVFEPDSPFQRFQRTGNSATGPGVADMKGGIVVMIAALKALRKAGLLEGASISVFLTGDEESPGEPVAATRREFIEAGKSAKAALCFETGVRRDNQDYVSTARRGFTGWELRTKGATGHSGRIFSDALGHGAIFELSRVISQLHDQLREPNLTFNVGVAVGGTEVKANADGSGSFSGKTNIVPAEAIARGEIRALTPEQVARVKDKMHAIAAKSLPGTSAKITFDEGYPPMAPTAGNKRLLAALNEASRLAGLPEVGELDPMERGAGDISFIAPYVDSLSGLGAIGSGSHSPKEIVDLDSIPRQVKRAALLIYRLSR